MCFGFDWQISRCRGIIFFYVLRSYKYGSNTFTAERIAARVLSTSTQQVHTSPRHLISCLCQYLHKHNVTELPISRTSNLALTPVLLSVRPFVLPPSRAAPSDGVQRRKPHEWMPQGWAHALIKLNLPAAMNSACNTCRPKRFSAAPSSRFSDPLPTTRTPFPGRIVGCACLAPMLVEREERAGRRRRGSRGGGDGSLGISRRRKLASSSNHVADLDGGLEAGYRVGP